MKKVNQDSDSLNLYEAACLVKMSPGLLEWLTSYAAKHGDKTKLISDGNISGVPTFNKVKLLEFNQWLHKPWSNSSRSNRPNIPQKIKEEIIKEAATTCAICHGHAETCEAAHIDPVHKSKDNHPHNLIWLCANHHTAFDSGLFGPLVENQDFVAALKETLLQYSLATHTVYADAMKQAFYLLEAGKRAAAIVSKTEEDIKTVEAVGAKILDDVLKLTTKRGRANASDKDGRALFDKLAGLTKATEFINATSSAEKLHVLEEVHDEFQVAAGMAECPLCKGSGVRDGDDCSYCGGNRQIDRRFAENYDGHDYEDVDCPACKGKGHFGRYDECPECHGNCQMERRFAELVSLSKYREVDCPNCEGTGVRDNDDCPFCNGQAQIEEQLAEAYDASQYDDVQCDVCRGRGQTNRYEECPKCSGKGNVTGQMHEARTKRDYEFVSCPKCKGAGAWNQDDCPRCFGIGDVPRFSLNLD